MSEDGSTICECEIPLRIANVTSSLASLSVFLWVEASQVKLISFVLILRASSVLDVVSDRVVQR